MSSLDAVSLEDLRQRLATGKKVQTQFARARALLSGYVVGILNHAMGEHRPNRDSTTPNSLLRAIKLLYIMPALLHSPDGRIKRRQRFALVESGYIVLLLPWLSAYTRRGDSRQRDATQEASEEAILERAWSECRHAGGVKVTARNLLAEPRAAGDEETWHTLVVEFPSEDHIAVSAAAVAAVLASATEIEEGNAPPWRPDDECASEVLFNVISSRSVLSCARNDGQRFVHLQSIIHTDIGRQEFGRGMTAFWRRIVDEPDAFQPEFWQLFFQSSLTALGENCRTVCVGMAWRRFIAAWSMRQWQPRLEEVNRKVRQFGVAVPGGALQD